MSAGSLPEPSPLGIAAVQDLYEAAVETRDWHSFVHQVAALLRSNGLILVSRSVEMKSLAPVEQAGGAAGVYRLDPADIAVAAWKAVDGAVSGGGRAIAVLGSFLARERGRTILIGIKSLAPSDAIDVERSRLQEAAAVLLRIFTAHRRVCQTRFLSQVQRDVLNKLPFGILVVDHDGRILSRNGRAQHMMARRDGLLSLKGRIALDNAAENQRLLQAIAHAARHLPFAAESNALSASRPSMAPPLSVLVLSLHEAAADLGPAPPSAALIVVGDPECTYDISAEVAARFFGLTLAEARVLVDIVNGTSLNEMAEARELTRNTLKTQLNQVFRKTQTNRQSDLVKVVLSSPAIVISLHNPSDAAELAESLPDDALGFGLTAVPG